MLSNFCNKTIVSIKADKYILSSALQLIAFEILQSELRYFRLHVLSLLGVMACTLQRVSQPKLP